MHFKYGDDLYQVTSPSIRRAFRLVANKVMAYWASPLRALRHAFGWQPDRIPVEKAKSILVVRPDDIGDVILTTPFLRELRRAAPGAHIALVVKSACYELVEHNTNVDAVHVLSFRSAYNFNSARDKHFYLVHLMWAARRLRRSQIFRRNFDLVLLPRRGPDHYRSELVAQVLAGSGALIVHREKHFPVSSFTSNYEPLAPFVYSNPQVEHEVLHNLHFLQWCGAPVTASSVLELVLTALDRRFAADILDERCRYVAIATGAGDASRCWPVDRFAAIAAWLQNHFGLTPILLGAPLDPVFNGNLNLTGATTLRQAAAIIARCKLFLGNDSGLMHVAAAMRVPVVAISAFRVGGDANHHNSQERFHPINVPHRILRPSSGRNPLAIEAVTVDDVRLACSDLLESAIVEYQ